jgi:hypothetical protein
MPGGGGRSAPPSFARGVWATLACSVYFLVVLVMLIKSLWIQFGYCPVDGRVLEVRWGPLQSGGKAGSWYALESLVVFEADGQKRQAWVEWPLRVSDKNASNADAVRNRVHIGQEVHFFYDPLRPTAAVLDKDRWTWIMCWAVNVLFSAVLVVAFSAEIRRFWPTTFPRGAKEDSTYFLRRLPWGFHFALAGALLCIAVGGLVLLLELNRMLAILAIFGLVWTLRQAARL